jgi:hypothetical protein
MRLIPLCVCFSALLSAIWVTDAWVAEGRAPGSWLFIMMIMLFHLRIPGAGALAWSFFAALLSLYFIHKDTGFCGRELWVPCGICLALALATTLGGAAWQWHRLPRSTLLITLGGTVSFAMGTWVATGLFRDQF